jgi:hypothetical protein
MEKDAYRVQEAFIRANSGIVDEPFDGDLAGKKQKVLDKALTELGVILNKPISGVYREKLDESMNRWLLKFYEI